MWRQCSLLLALCLTALSQNYHYLEREMQFRTQYMAARATGGDHFFDALSGDFEAQFQLGWSIAARGDIKEGLAWLRLAGTNGHPLACWMLADLGTRLQTEWNQDLRLEAVFWLKKSAELGLVEGQSGLARLYETGQNVERDIVQAERWYRLAAEQRQPEASYRLARILMQDANWATEAERFLRIAADAGDPRALYELAMLLLGHQPKLVRDPRFQSFSQTHSDTWIFDALGSMPVKTRSEGRTLLELSRQGGCPNCAAILGWLSQKQKKAASSKAVLPLEFRSFPRCGTSVVSADPFLIRPRPIL